MRHALVGPAEVLAHEGPEIIDAAGQQFARDRRRIVCFAGEQADGFRAANLVEHVIERPAADVGEVGFFPRFLYAGESQLHAADMRHHVEMFRPNLVTEVTGHAIEERITRRHHDHLPLAEAGTDGFDDFLNVGADPVALRLQIRQQTEHVVGPKHKVGLGQELPRARGQASRAIAADTEDRDFRKGRTHAAMLAERAREGKWDATVAPSVYLRSCRRNLTDGRMTALPVLE